MGKEGSNVSGGRRKCLVIDSRPSQVPKENRCVSHRKTRTWRLQNHKVYGCDKVFSLALSLSWFSADVKGHCSAVFDLPFRWFPGFCALLNRYTNCFSARPTAHTSTQMGRGRGCVWVRGDTRGFDWMVVAFFSLSDSLSAGRSDLTSLPRRAGTEM